MVACFADLLRFVKRYRDGTVSIVVLLFENNGERISIDALDVCMIIESFKLERRDEENVTYKELRN